MSIWILAAAWFVVAVALGLFIGNWLERLVDRYYPEDDS